MTFRAYRSNPELCSHIRSVRSRYQRKFEKASSIASYPSEWIKGRVSLEAAKSLCRRAIALIEMGREAYYTWPHSQNSGWHGQISTWGDVMAYLNATERKKNAFSRFGGINNPFITGDATLID